MKIINQLRFFVFVGPIFLVVGNPGFEVFDYFFVVDILSTVSYIPAVIDSSPKSWSCLFIKDKRKQYFFIIKIRHKLFSFKSVFINSLVVFSWLNLIKDGNYLIFWLFKNRFVDC